MADVRNTLRRISNHIAYQLKYQSDKMGTMDYNFMEETRVAIRYLYNTIDNQLHDGRLPCWMLEACGEEFQELNIANLSSKHCSLSICELQHLNNLVNYWIKRLLNRNHFFEGLLYVLSFGKIK